MEERIFKERIFLTPVEIRKRRGDFFLVRHEGTMCYLINIFFSSNMFVQGNEDLVRHEGTMCYLVQGNEDGPALFGLLQVAPSSRLANSLNPFRPFCPLHSMALSNQHFAGRAPALSQHNVTVSKHG